MTRLRSEKADVFLNLFQENGEYRSGPDSAGRPPASPLEYHRLMATRCGKTNGLGGCLNRISAEAGPATLRQPESQLPPSLWHRPVPRSARDTRLLPHLVRVPPQNETRTQYRLPDAVSSIPPLYLLRPNLSTNTKKTPLITSSSHLLASHARQSRKTLS